MTVSATQHQSRLKLWANSGDSHFIEPEDLWRSRLPKRLAEL
ncbi:MAG TPA: amidohydrolase, partial [Mycobacterium sp.]